MNTQKNKYKKESEVINQLGLKVADNVDSLLAYWDKDQICRFANYAFFKKFGKTREELIGKYNLRELLGEEAYKEAHKYVQGVLKGNTQEFENSIVFKENERRQLLVTYIPDKEGEEVKGFFVKVSDITEIKQAHERETKCAILKGKNQEMDSFAKIISHDIREPMLNIKQYLMLLVNECRPHLDVEAVSYVTGMFRALERMDTLTQGLLNYSILSQTKILEQVDSNEVIKRVLKKLDLTIQETKAVIKLENLPVLNAFLFELGILFENLIANAIKFRRGSVIPEITIAATPLHKGWQFEVKDNGIGIDENQREKIFNLFQRLHSRKEYEGTGIGLGYCKKIVELHNGSIWVESVPGEWSTFYFTVFTV